HDAGPGEASQAPGGPMNPYERPVVDRLQSEVAQIPLPPRERWTPPERHRSRLLPALAATVVVVALAVIIAAPVLERVSSQGEGVGAAGSSTAPRTARTVRPSWTSQGIPSPRRTGARRLRLRSKVNTPR